MTPYSFLTPIRSVQNGSWAIERKMSLLPIRHSSSLGSDEGMFSSLGHFMTLTRYRQCPGQNVAEPGLFLTMAMTLSTFSIEKARDEMTGVCLEPVAKAEWLPGTIRYVFFFFLLGWEGDSSFCLVLVILDLSDVLSSLGLRVPLK